MRSLFLRFFLSIWGAIMGTAVIVIAYVALAGGAPPDHIRARDLLPLAETAARAAYAAGGRQAVKALFAQDPALRRQILLLDKSPCPRPDPVAGNAQSCLILAAPPEASKARRLLMPFLTPMTIGALVAALMALTLARRFMRPLGRLGEALAALAEGQLHRRIGADIDQTEPSLARVGQAFDEAAAKLQELTESRNRLFHDISHELRSPLARLQAQAALLAQNPSRLPALLPRIEADIARMNHLIEEILTLARLEHDGADRFRPAAIDLVDLLDPILSDAGFEGQGRQIAVDYVGPDRLEAQVDAELIHRAAENILRNALRHAPEGSRVELRLARGAGGIRLEICDRGPGVDPSRLTTIFGAFEREGQGFGLGLAIAAHAIRLHGGTVRAENRPGGGLCVLCEWPG